MKNTINVNALTATLSKIKFINNRMSITQKQLNNGFNAIMAIKVQLMFELETPQKDSALFQTLDAITRKLFITNEEMVIVTEYATSIMDEEFVEKLTNILN